MNVYFSHVYNETNNCTDKMASLRVNKQCDGIEFLFLVVLLLKSIETLELP